VAAENARQFFEGLETRAAASSKAAGLNATYLFDIDGAGKWTVRAENGKVSVREGEEEAETTISASEDTFMKIVNGEQNATSAFMMGKLKVRGDMGNAMKLQQLF
jgi:putative sterol carrier protein